MLLDLVGSIGQVSDPQDGQFQQPLVHRGLAQQGIGESDEAPELGCGMGQHAKDVHGGKLLQQVRDLLRRIGRIGIGYASHLPLFPREHGPALLAKRIHRFLMILRAVGE